MGQATTGQWDSDCSRGVPEHSCLVVPSGHPAQLALILGAVKGTCQDMAQGARRQLAESAMLVLGLVLATQGQPCTPR